MMKVTVSKEVEIEITPKDLAESFCRMDAETQADFFKNCADLADEWTKSGGAPETQWASIHRHLFADLSKPSVVAAGRMLKGILGDL